MDPSQARDSDFESSMVATGMDSDPEPAVQGGCTVMHRLLTTVNIDEGQTPLTSVRPRPDSGHNNTAAGRAFSVRFLSHSSVNGGQKTDG